MISSRGADVRPVAGAWDNEGRDVAPQLATVDHQFVNDLNVLQFAGFTDPHTLTLDLGEPYKGGTLRLLLNGYVEYFSATSLYAAHQAGLDPVSPYIEAQDASGKWVRVLDDMGFPAGLPRTMVADLSGKLADRRDACAHRNEPADLLGPDPGGSNSGCGSDPNERKFHWQARVWAFTDIRET